MPTRCIPSAESGKSSWMLRSRENRRFTTGKRTTLLDKPDKPGLTTWPVGPENNQRHRNLESIGLIAIATRAVDEDKQCRWARFRWFIARQDSSSEHLSEQRLHREIFEPGGPRMERHSKTTSNKLQESRYQSYWRFLWDSRVPVRPSLDIGCSSPRPSPGDRRPGETLLLEFPEASR